MLDYQVPGADEGALPVPALRSGRLGRWRARVIHMILRVRVVPRAGHVVWGWSTVLPIRDDRVR